MNAFKCVFLGFVAGKLSKYNTTLHLQAVGAADQLLCDADEIIKIVSVGSDAKIVAVERGSHGTTPAEKDAEAEFDVFTVDSAPITTNGALADDAVELVFTTEPTGLVADDYLLITEGSDKHEVVKMTAQATVTLTITRGLFGTTETEFTNNAVVEKLMAASTPKVMLAAADYDESVTSITLTALDGIVDGNYVQLSEGEIMKVSGAPSGNALTVVRAQYDTVAHSHYVGGKVSLVDETDTTETITDTPAAETTTIKFDAAVAELNAADLYFQVGSEILKTTAAQASDYTVTVLRGQLGSTAVDISGTPTAKVLTITDKSGTIAAVVSGGGGEACSAKFENEGGTTTDKFQCPTGKPNLKSSGTCATSACVNDTTDQGHCCEATTGGGGQDCSEKFENDGGSTTDKFQCPTATPNLKSSSTCAAAECLDEATDQGHCCEAATTTAAVTTKKAGSSKSVLMSGLIFL